MNQSDKLSAPRLVGVGGVFIDDIVLSDGTTYMGRLGGGVVHALMGAALWGEHPGILAVVGKGLPLEAASQIKEQLDTTGLIELPLPQIRAWQIFEEDGTRRELYRVRETAPFIAGPQPHNLPIIYESARAFYLLQDFSGLHAWRSRVKGLILWEPLQQIMIPENHDLFRSALRECKPDVVSPNLAEALAIYGNLPPDKLATAMLNDGARMVALRMGEAGSIIAGENRETQHIPAVPVTHLIDQTGAGNTYCGALLCGIVQGKGLAEAAVMGSVSASFCIETIGVVNIRQIANEEIERRWNWGSAYLREVDSSIS